MKETLFRGKRLDNNEWVSSGNIIVFNDEGDGKHYFIPKPNDECVCTHDAYDNILSFDKGTFYKVDPKTVGQSTGLTDKTGKQIFAGDILTVYGGEEYEFTGLVAFDKGCWILAFKVEGWDFLCTNAKDAEIIGNIHDNPELFTGGTAE